MPSDLYPHLIPSDDFLEPVIHCDPPMFQLSTFIQRNTRRIVAIGAITISLLAAIGLASASQSATPMWVATHPLSPGAVISAADIERIDATLGSSTQNYYRGSSKVIGNVVTRSIGLHEFIPLNAIAQAGSISDYRQLPIGIAKSDLPSDLGAGDRVDLYSIPKDSGRDPELVASNIRIQGVDNKSRDLGGAVTVLFLLHDREIMPIISSFTTGRIVVVRNAL